MDNDLEVRTGSAVMEPRPPGGTPDEDCTEANDLEKDEKIQDDNSQTPMERSVWSGRLDFTILCLGYALGIGNVWMMPFLIYKNGGGAFLVPHFLFLILGGMPLVYLETALGQYANLGPISVWNCAPFFKGIGYSMVIVAFLVGTYYNVIIAWAIYYLFASMTDNLPWANCDNDWNTASCCSSQYLADNCSSVIPDVAENISCRVCFNAQSTNTSIRYDVSMGNESLSLWDGNIDSMFTTPSHEYFTRHVINMSDGIDLSLGGVHWSVALCLVLAWFIVLCCLVKGIRVTAKVAYVTVIVPYIILLVLLIRSCLLDGAREGLIYHLHPDWSRLQSLTIWLDAATHVLFSLGTGYGGLIALSSYNRFTNNCARDAILIPVMNSLSSIFVSIVVFATLGHIAKTANLPVESIYEGGTHLGLAFEVFPSGLVDVSGSVAYSILFFLMLVLVGIDSQYLMVLTLTTAIFDELPRKVQRRRTELILLFALCALMCLLGMVFVTRSGAYLIVLLGSYVVTWPVLIIVLMECLALAWVYGAAKLDFNIWTMTGSRPSCWWNVSWRVTTPAVILLALLYSINTHDTITLYGNKLPIEAFIVGYVIVGLSTVMMLVWPVIAVVRGDGSFKDRVLSLFRPAEHWGEHWIASDWVATQHDLPEYMLSEKEELGGISNPAYQEINSACALGEEATGAGFLPTPNMYDNGDIIDTGSVDWDGDENLERGNWSGRFDFLMSGLGYSVGIGNVWRFPYLVYQSGGGAFFIPYILMLILVGIPLFYMEVAFGQFASVGPITIWKVSPIFKGVGYAGVIAVSLVCIYYNVMTSWAVYYFFASMSAKLPWANCNNTWNTPSCRMNYNDSGVIRVPSRDCVNGSLEEISLDADPSYVHCNATGFTNLTSSSPSEEYFFNNVLQLSPGIDHLGYPRWHLSLCLLLCWIITFVALIKGVKSAGKVVYVTVIFPYLILLVLFIRYATMDSDAYLEGIRYYVTPQWSSLARAEVWGAAASQIFFSIGLSQGGLVALSSYNRFHYDCYRDAYIVCLVDTLTSIFAGFVIFAILGVMAEEAGTDVANVVTSKFTLAYVAYPEAVTRLPLAPMWSLLFFLMLFSLAIDSHFLMCEGIVIALMDEFPRLLAKRRIWVISVLCVCGYALGLPLVSEGGLYILILMDNYAAAWAPLVIGLAMCVALSWVYKIHNFSANIKAMSGTSPSLWWKLMWMFVTPATLTFILIFSWVAYTEPRYDDYVYPAWAHVVAVLTAIVSIAFIPGVAIYQVIVNNGVAGLTESCKKSGRPDSDWGPALDKHRVAAYIPGVVNTQDTPYSRTAAWVAKASVAAAQVTSNVGKIFHTASSATLDLLIDDEKSTPKHQTGILSHSKKKSQQKETSGDPGHSPAKNTDSSSSSKPAGRTRRVTFPADEDSRSAATTESPVRAVGNSRTKTEATRRRRKISKDQRSKGRTDEPVIAVEVHQSPESSHVDSITAMPTDGLSALSNNNDDIQVSMSLGAATPGNEERPKSRESPNIPMADLNTNNSGCSVRDDADDAPSGFKHVDCRGSQSVGSRDTSSCSSESEIHMSTAL